jgi:two-component system, sensor histidine kinase and response regulator
MNVDVSSLWIEKEETGRVLVVDDSSLSRALVVAFLEHLGHRTAAVDNGRDAVAAIETRDYSLVLMDIEMPIMDGFCAIARIRAREQVGRHLPVIAMTGHARADLRNRALAAGFDDVLEKPFEIERLRETIAGQLGRKGH